MNKIIIDFKKRFLYVEEKLILFSEYQTKKAEI
jgi:hypothetical protein